MNELLQFEQEKCRDPRRFPMHFRLKLDVCGIKLAKRDWARFDSTTRKALLAVPCETPAQIAAFRTLLLNAIHACGGEVVEIEARMPAGTHFPWMNRTTVPDSVRLQVTSLVKEAVDFARWAELSDLQRFALIKLTEPGKSKPALRGVLEEFSLLPPDGV
ncbi:MAG: nitrate reductase associated protein [Burkholderiaceae bacterium]